MLPRHLVPSMRAALPLLALLLLTTVVPSTSASSPMPPSVWLVHTTVEAVVQENYATVNVIADITNRGPDPEFPFSVRVPDDAFVTGLLIERDGTTYEAVVKDRAEARQEYEEWKAQEQTGGLVERTRRTSVYSYLINVAEFTSVRATLTYERYLAADRGIYNLSLEAPVSGFGEDTGATFRVSVRDSDGVTALWGEPRATRSGDTLTYEVGPRPGVEHPTPFTASYTLDPTATSGTLLTAIVDGQGYFAHRFRADDDEAQLPMDLVLVLDVSGSMAGEKLRQMVDAAKQVVSSLDADDRLHLVAFSTDARSSWSGLLAMTPEDRRRAASEIDGLFDAGGTNIEAGIRKGFEGLSGVDWAREEGRFPAIVLLTDGQPTAGVTSRDELLRIARGLNTREVPVFGIAFGDDADWTLIRHLAQDGEGAAIRVPPGTGAEVDLRRFMAALTTPVLRDVAISYGPGVTAYRAGAPVLFAGSELLVVGTYDPARGISGAITGWSPAGERRSTFDGSVPADLGFLPRLVAYQQVRELQAQEDADGPTASTTARIVELALEHGFVTDHTSLVLTLPPREAREFVASDGRETMEAGRTMSSTSTASAPAPPMTYDASSGGNGQGTATSAVDASYGRDTTDLTADKASSDDRRVVPGSGASPELAGSSGGDVQVPGVGIVATLALALGVALMLGRKAKR